MLLQAGQHFELIRRQVALCRKYVLAMAVGVGLACVVVRRGVWPGPVLC
jgi:hypothetical protein